jgi:hypothetical protein
VSDSHTRYAFHTFANLEQVFQSSETTKNVLAIMRIAIRERVVGKCRSRRAPSIYFPTASLNGPKCRVWDAMEKRAPFYIFHPKKHLMLTLGLPSNAEDFEIGVVVSTKHEDGGQGG